MKDQTILIIGTILFFLLFVLEFFLAVIPKAFAKSGRIAILWTSLYVFFLFIIQGLFIARLLTQSSAHIVNVLATAIVLIALTYHVLLFRKMEQKTVEKKIDDVKIQAIVKVQEE